MPLKKLRIRETMSKRLGTPGKASSIQQCTQRLKVLLCGQQVAEQMLNFAVVWEPEKHQREDRSQVALPRDLT